VVVVVVIVDGRCKMVTGGGASAASVDSDDTATFCKAAADMITCSSSLESDSSPQPFCILFWSPPPKIEQLKL
jgi:hypothetical protein